MRQFTLNCGSNLDPQSVLSLYELQIQTMHSPWWTYAVSDCSHGLRLLFLPMFKIRVKLLHLQQDFLLTMAGIEGLAVPPQSPMDLLVFIIV